MFIPATISPLLLNEDTNTPTIPPVVETPPIPPTVTPVPTTPAINYDPDLPVYPDDTSAPAYVAPNHTYTVGGMGEQKPAESYIDPSKATVEGRVTGLMQSGNPLLGLAQTQNAQNYNKRGLLNSANEVAGGTLAVMKEAREIATPDAKLYGDFGLNQAKTDSESLLNNQAGEISQDTEMLRGDISGRLTTQEFKGNKQIQGIADRAAMERINVENEWKELINFDNLDSREKIQLTQTSQVLGGELIGGIERVLRDPNIENKSDAVSSLISVYRSDMNLAASFTGQTIIWS